MAAFDNRKVAYIENVESTTPAYMAEWLAEVLHTEPRELEVVFLYKGMKRGPPLCAAVRMYPRLHQKCMDQADWMYTTTKLRVRQRGQCRKVAQAQVILQADGSRTVLTQASQHWSTRVEERAESAPGDEGQFWTWDTIHTQGGDSFCYAAIDCGCMIHEKPPCKKYQWLPEQYLDSNLLMNKSLSAGVQRMILLGITSLRSAERAKAFCSLHPQHCRFSVGFHPSYLKRWTAEKQAVLESLAHDPLCVAIGECGVDFSPSCLHPDLQVRLLKLQVELACKLRKPLLIYERDLQSLVLEVLDQFKGQLPPVAIDARSDNSDLNLYIQRGYFIIVTGWRYHTYTMDTVFFRWLSQLEPWKRDHLLLVSSTTTTNTNLPSFVDCVLLVEIQRAVTWGIKAHQCTDRAMDWYRESKSKYLRPTPLILPVLIEITAIGCGVPRQEMAKLCLENAQRFFREVERCETEEEEEDAEVEKAGRTEKEQLEEDEEMRKDEGESSRQPEVTTEKRKSVAMGWYWIECGQQLVGFVLLTALSFTAMAAVGYLRQ